MHKEVTLRIRVPPVLMKKYKLICIEKDLSIPKQTAELIRQFVEVHEQNKKLMKHLEK